MRATCGVQLKDRKSALDFEVEGQREKGRLRITLKKLVDEESVMVILRR